MDFVTIRDFRTYPKQTWAKLEEQSRLVVTNNGKPFALMLQINNNDIEETIASIDQAEAMRLLNKIQLQATKKGSNIMTMEDINKEIAAVRKGESDNA